MHPWRRKTIDYGFRDRAGLVTGAGSGIGRATAITFARSGAAVIVSDVDDRGGREAVALIEGAGGKARNLKCDVGDADAFGRLDFAVNNAGISGVEKDEYEEEDWDKSVRINLTGVMRCMREESKFMIERGAARSSTRHRSSA